MTFGEKNNNVDPTHGFREYERKLHRVAQKRDFSI